MSVNTLTSSFCWFVGFGLFMIEVPRDARGAVGIFADVANRRLGVIALTGPRVGLGSRAHVKRRRFWLDLERGYVAPKLIVALGASAASAILGRSATIRSLRGKPIPLEDGTLLLVTVHPSYLLRLPVAADRMRETQLFESDLRQARELLH